VSADPAVATAAPRRPLGKILRERGILSEDQLRIALIEQKRNGAQLGATLVKLGFVSEATLREALSENLGQSDIDVSRVVADPAALALVPKSFAMRFSVLPVALDRSRKVLTVAVGNPNNIVVLDQLNVMLRDEVTTEALISSEAEVTRAIDRFYGHELSIDGILNEIETGEVDYESLTSADGGYTQPIVRLIDAIVGDAVSRRTRTRLRAHPLPDRRCIAANPRLAREVLVRHVGANQGDVGHEHRRIPRSPGWSHQSASAGSIHRFPRGGAAHDLRRERGVAHSR
jgi:hypothetical protein